MYIFFFFKSHLICVLCACISVGGSGLMAFASSHQTYIPLPSDSGNFTYFLIITLDFMFFGDFCFLGFACSIPVSECGFSGLVAELFYPPLNFVQVFAFWVLMAAGVCMWVS